MALAPRIIALDFGRQLIFDNATFENQYDFQSTPFKAGDTARFYVYIVQRDASLGPGRLSAITPTGTLKIALSTLAAPTSTVHTSTTLTLSENVFTGDLPLNVSGVTSLFTSSADNRSVIIEFEFDDGGGKQSFDKPAVIRHQAITNDLADPQPPDVALGSQEARGLFVLKSGVTRMIWIDADGSGRRYVEYVRGGTKRMDPIGT